MNQNKTENIMQDWQFLCAVQVKVKWGSIFLHPSGPSKSFMCPAPPKILWVLGIEVLKKMDSKKCNRLHNKRQKGTYTRHHWPNVILNTWRRAPLRKVLKGLALYGTYGYQVIKRVTPVPILSHIDTIHTLTLLLKSLWQMTFPPCHT